MRLGLLSGVVATVAVVSAPAMALQSITLPQPPGDSATNSQDSNTSAQDQFSTTQTDGKNNPFGSFHFNVTSGQNWPGEPYRSYRPQNSTPDAYGNAATPGSEFSTSNFFNPH